MDLDTASVTHQSWPAHPREAASAIAPVISHYMVVNTHPQRERLALEHLARQGYTAYLPLVRRTVRHVRANSPVLKALFPNYLFVAADTPQRPWRPLLSTIGVRSLICFGQEPGRLDPTFVEELKAQEVAGAIELPGWQPAAGDIVEIDRGPLSGRLARVLACDGRARVTILLEMMSRPVRTSIAASELRPTAPEHSAIPRRTSPSGAGPRR